MSKDPRLTVYLNDRRWEHEQLRPPHLGMLQIGLYATTRWAVRIALEMAQQFPDVPPDAIQTSVTLLLQKDLSRYPNIEVIYDE